MAKLLVYYNTNNNYYRYKLVSGFYRGLAIDEYNQYDEVLVNAIDLIDKPRKKRLRFSFKLYRE